MAFKMKRFWVRILMSVGLWIYLTVVVFFFFDNYQDFVKNEFTWEPCCSKRNDTTNSKFSAPRGNEKFTEGFFKPMIPFQKLNNSTEPGHTNPLYRSTGDQSQEGVSPTTKSLSTQLLLHHVFDPITNEGGSTTNKYFRQAGKPEVPDDPNAPGENGTGVVIDRKSLTPDEQAIYDEGLKRNSFNQYASDMISLHRTLPDYRHHQCGSVKYPDDLPTTSVVVIFHNEAWSALFRTVHSVIDRSPPRLLKEIILVDDCSTFDHLKQQLTDYVDKLPKVRLLRSKERVGLIRARLLGAAVATGDVLTFLDSHCECVQGWLEPLLARIAQNHTIVVTPLIDVIMHETLEYRTIIPSVGGFSWSLEFTWHNIPASESRRRRTDADPIRSPTMAGGLFSMDRKYFEYLGKYDPGMEIWGGENLELSFRIWMCGGSLETLPCSRVGHIFRPKSPYTWKQGVNVWKKNNVRLAEVWMDDYKKLYYERFHYALGDYGDITSRIALRKKLGCKSFKWFIDNVYPELFVPSEALASGEIKSKGVFTAKGFTYSMCLDSPSDKEHYNQAVTLFPCHGQGGNQMWMLSKIGEIRRDDGCFDYDGRSLKILECHGMEGNQQWEYTKDNRLRHVVFSLCIELWFGRKQIELQPCRGISQQIWLWHRQNTES